MNDLTPATIESFKVSPGWWFGSSFTARWSELDSFGHVSHRTYLVWCEEVRNGYFSELGLFPFARDSAGPVLKEIGFTYERSLALGTPILVTAKTSWIRRTSFRMEYAVWNNGLVGQGHAICVWLINSTGERVPVSDEIRHSMISRDGAHDLQAS